MSKTSCDGSIAERHRLRSRAKTNGWTADLTLINKAICVNPGMLEVGFFSGRIICFCDCFYITKVAPLANVAANLQSSGMQAFLLPTNTRIAAHRPFLQRNSVPLCIHSRKIRVARRVTAGYNTIILRQTPWPNPIIAIASLSADCICHAKQRLHLRGLAGVELIGAICNASRITMMLITMCIEN